MPDRPQITLNIRDYSKLDVLGRSLLWRQADLSTRFWLLDLASKLYDAGELKASCSVYHAEVYLRDRLVYELYPWPKGCIKTPGWDATDAR